MSEVIMDISRTQLRKIGIRNANINYQLSAEELTQQSLKRKEGVLRSWL